jgi:probable HAF family extracellular repeat protein
MSRRFRVLGRVVWLLAACVMLDTARARASDVFTYTGSLNEGRNEHAATLLADGRVFVVGGWGSQAGYFFALSSAEVYDAATGTFTRAGAMAQARIGPVAVRLDSGAVLVLGGFGPHPLGGYQSIASAEVYDPVTGAFSPTADMTTARQDMTATLLPDGTVLVAGGFDFYFGPTSSAEIYDPSSGTFSPTGSLIQARSHHTATLLPNGQVLITGGCSSFFCARSGELYDPATRSFSATGDMTDFHSSGLTANLLADGRVLMAGGQTTAAEIYDPANDTFTPTGNMLADQTGGTATLLQGGAVLITGGYWAPRKSERYEPGSGTFVPAAALQQGRSSHTATLLPDGTVLVVGGSGSPQSAELYHSSGYVDTVPPTISVPFDLTVGAFDAGGVPVYYDVTVNDDADSFPTLSCIPASGSTFPVGDTTVNCTATDSSGNTSSASFKVTVIAPIDVTVALSAKGSLDSTTDVVTLSGTVACNRATFVFISGQLKETVAHRAVLEGSFSTFVSCVPPVTTWSATTVANNGRFGAGPADASASAFACDLSCDFDQTSRTVTLGKGHVAAGLASTAAAAGTAAATAAAASYYQVTDLGTLNGDSCLSPGGMVSPGRSSFATAFNDNGQAVGGSCAFAGFFQRVIHAFSWSGGTMTDIGTLGVGGSPDGSTAYGINDAGQIVGLNFMNVLSGGTAVVWSGGTITSLDTVLGGGFSSAYDINNAGQIVGLRGVLPDTSSWSAFLYDTASGQVTTLPGIGGTFRTSAVAINDAGDVAGYGTAATNVFHAVRWSAQVPTDLGTLGGTHSFASGINGAGDVVGSSSMPGDAGQHAFLYSGGVMQDLGTLGGSFSWAAGINEAGLVVGSATTISGQGHAFIHDGTSMVDLNDRVSPAAGWVLTQATAVNGSGIIVGTGQINNETHAFLLTPSTPPVDTTPPVLTVPADFTVEATDAAGAVVYYVVTARDDVDPNPTVACVPPSLSTFSIGTTTVECVATDNTGKSASASFNVTVVARFDISLELASRHAVDPKTGIVTLTGTVACNRGSAVSISGQLQEIVAQRALLLGTFFTFFACVEPVTAWSTPVVANNGRFGAGPAEASASAFACERSCDSDYQSGPVQLVGGHH